MRANSRSSIRWGVATAAIALALLPVTFKSALAGADSNGRLVAAHPNTLTDDKQAQQAPGFAADIRDTPASGTNGDADDGSLIRDDSDVASVDGSANDDVAADAGDELTGGSF
jgi:hypothetical protein